MKIILRLLGIFSIWLLASYMLVTGDLLVACTLLGVTIALLFHCYKYKGCNNGFN